MQLIYCYIKKFRNIENQEVRLSDRFYARLEVNRLIIEKCSPNTAKDYLYGDNFLRNLHVIVGRTGSGKTNFLQMIGMIKWGRLDAGNDGEYLMLYQTAKEDEFVIEIVGLPLAGFESARDDISSKYGFVIKEKAYRFKYNFDTNAILNIRELRQEEMENTHIINAFDRYSFVHYPYKSDDRMGGSSRDGMLPRTIVQYGKSNVSMECMYLQDYVKDLPAGNIKRNASFVIKWNNWQDKIMFDLDEQLVKNEYWTYKSMSEEQREENFRKGKFNHPIDYPPHTTPQSRFLHDLMTDYALYLRKWAEIIEPYQEEGFSLSHPMHDLGIKHPDMLPDGRKMSILQRIDWLCQYIDYHTDEITGNRGLVWQAGSDVRDLFDILRKMDSKYFTDEEFSIPVVDIDTSDHSPMYELFERMDQYRPDEVGVFTEQLLPYHWTYVSSGEYQYTKIWSILETFGVRLKTMNQGERYTDAKHPNIILLLDEPESYMHPEMCRCFIHKMREILNRRYRHADFQVLLSTHSPFILSDVLSEQVIKMDYDEFGKCCISQGVGTKYFAANIHSIMADGFFLRYTIGEQARLFLTEKFNRLKTLTERNEALTAQEKEEVQAMQKFAANIGDDIIRLSFENLIHRLL